MTKFKEIDGCPVPAVIYDELVEIKRRTGIIYTSVYRGTDPKAAGILKRFGKSTQAWLYRAYWVLHLPGYRPANPPNFSTHELFNDGVAFRLIPRGAPIAPHLCGIDSTTGAGFVEEASELGFDAMLTYPGNPLESQHANFRKKPKFITFKALKRGAHGRRVKHIYWALRYIRSPHTHEPYISKWPEELSKDMGKGFAKHFGEFLEHAITRFQADHQQKADGIWGRQTARQMEVAVRHRKAHLKKQKQEERERKAKAKRKARKAKKK